MKKEQLKKIIGADLFDVNNEKILNEVLNLSDKDVNHILDSLSKKKNSFTKKLLSFYCNDELNELSICDYIKENALYCNDEKVLDYYINISLNIIFNTDDDLLHDLLFMLANPKNSNLNMLNIEEFNDMVFFSSFISVFKNNKQARKLITEFFTDYVDSGLVKEYIKLFSSDKFLKKQDISDILEFIDKQEYFDSISAIISIFSENNILDNHYEKVKDIISKKLDDYEWIVTFKKFIVGEWWNDKIDYLNTFLDYALQLDKEKLSLFNDIVNIDYIIEGDLFEYVLDLFTKIDDYSVLKNVVYFIDNPLLHIDILNILNIIEEQNYFVATTALINIFTTDYILDDCYQKVMNITSKKLDDYKWICAFENVIVNDFWRGKNSLLNAFLDTSLKFDERKLSLYREIVFLDNLVDEGLFEYVLDLIDSINDHSLLEYVIYLISNQKLYNEDKELYFDYIKKLKDYVIYGSVGYLKKIYCYLNDSPYLHETLLVIRGNYEISKLKFLCDILDANSLFSSMYQYNTFLEVLPIVMELNESEQYDILCSLKYILNNKNILQFNIEFNKLIKNIKNNKSIHINNKNNDNKSKILEVLDEFNNDEEVTCDSFIRKRKK